MEPRRPHAPTPPRRPRFALATVLALALIGGCGDGSKKQAEPGPTLSRKATDGPVTITLTAAPSEFDVSRTTTVTLQVTAPRGVTIFLEDYDRILDEDETRFDFRLVHVAKSSAVPGEDDKLLWTQTLELEYTLPGNYELPPATVTYHEKATEGASTPEDARATTESLPIIVGATTAAEFTPEELARIAMLDPVELPVPWTWHLTWAIPTLALIVIIAVIVLVRRRRRGSAAIVPNIPAHEWAQRELALLIAKDLIGKGLIQSFYYGISDVVRGYVERRFHVRAPEMTTQEFLATVSDDIRFHEAHAAELDRFLNACDLVKYARYEPHRDQAEQLIRSAGDFVERTRERQASQIADPPTATVHGETAA